MEGCSDFRDIVRRLGRGSAASDEDRDCAQQLYRELFRIVDFGVDRRRYFRAESMVRNSARAVCAGFTHLETASPWSFDEKDRGCAIYTHTWNADLERCAHPGRAGHYRKDSRQRRRGAGTDEGPQSARRGKVADRAIARIRCVPRHGDANDWRRRTDGRDGRHVAEDRGLLRRRSGRGGQGLVDGSRTDHDRISRRGGRRRGYFDVLAVVHGYRQAQRYALTGQLVRKSGKTRARGGRQRGGLPLFRFMVRVRRDGGQKSGHAGMADLANACPPVVYRVDPGGRRGLAAVLSYV